MEVAMADLDLDDNKAGMTAPTFEDEPKRRHHYAVGVTRATVANLQEMIRDGRMKPGEALSPQRDLARDLKVSRATLREALSILATIGQIMAKPGARGFIVNGGRSCYALLALRGAVFLKGGQPQT
jgi:hypothetical protein